MKNKLIMLLLFGVGGLHAQSNNNGQLDNLSEFSTKQTIPIRMAGGVELSTDVYLPITSDSLVVQTTIMGQAITAELIPKGTQLILYPTMIDVNGDTVANPNPYQLPLIFTRTPYGKGGSNTGGAIFPFMGYAYAVQDMRGRYESEGVYLPMYSDSWDKSPYHQHNHTLDITNSNDSTNGRFHEDGWDSYQYLLHDFQKGFDLNNDGTIDTVMTVCNGSMGMFGASALGNSQYQLASAHRIDTSGKGLKCLLPIVATLEHYHTTGYHNGVYRTMISTGWITGQLRDINDSIGLDNSIQNNLHTPFDFGLTSKEDVIDLGVYHLTEAKLGNSNLAASYPNSIARIELDASHAMVDAQGEGAANGTYSRYNNIDVPTYHLTGWYDIFINGQIETWKNMKTELGGSSQQLQKLIIGPWAHQTIGSRTTGDQTYSANVEDVVGLPLSNIDPNNLDFAALMNTEILAWYRYNLNEKGYVHLGSPMVRIPESHQWQTSGVYTFRVPSADYDVELVDMINFLGGQTDLPAMPIEVDFGGGNYSTFYFNVPPLTSTPPFVLADTLETPPTPNFKNEVADVRFYVIGPTDSLATNVGVGNYWFFNDEFPLTGNKVQFVPYYLHQNGVLDGQMPTLDEGTLSFTHDPNRPVQTVGGSNMIVRTPQDDRNSQGQMNYADTSFANYTMNNGGVIQFETAILTDTLSIIGFPKATIYAKSNPQGVGSGLTDTDFFVRILDVYPDGREFNVIEGAVNARARAYARSIYNGQENDTAAFTNINIDQWYEFQFELLPIAYTFGKDHSMKVLISSGNFPRYQSNANVPIESGDFFRRMPNDSQSYTYQGQVYSPRIATNSLGFSTTRASRIELPVYSSTATVTAVANAVDKSSFEVEIYPNPTSDWVSISTAESSDFELTIYNPMGQQVYQRSYTGNRQNINFKKFAAGVYLVELWDSRSEQKSIKKLVKN